MKPINKEINALKQIQTECRKTLDHWVHNQGLEIENPANQTTIHVSVRSTLRNYREATNQLKLLTRINGS